MWPIPGVAQDKTEIVIGACLPMTGGVAVHGRDLKWAYESVINEVNAQGGIFIRDLGRKLKVKLVTVDNGTNPMKAAAGVERLIKVDKVDMLLGGAEPTCVFAGCAVAERYKVYYHTAFGFPPPVWLEKQFKWSTNFFFAMDQACSVPFHVLNSINENQRPKNVALMMEDSFSGKAFGGLLRSTAEKMGYKVAQEIKLQVAGKDYSAQIQQAKDAGIDAMLVYGSPDDVETLLKGLKKNNYVVPYFHTWKGAWAGAFWKSLGKDAQYVVTDGFWSADYPYEGANVLGESFYRTFNEHSVTVGLSYAIAQILTQAVEKAGSTDGAKVRTAVLNNTFDTVMGTVKYAPNGYASFPTIAAQWWDGKQMLVFPSEHAKWTVKLAPPWNNR
jgi:branched-chain amino acid transport system substrate-binding protein